MKKSTIPLLFLTILLLPIYLFAQCPTGNVSLATQAEVDQFTADYPNCDKISGYLLINGADINNLSGLSKISEISGYLKIANTQTTKINFENLKIIGDDLHVFDNQLLENIDLTQLTTLKGKLSFFQNSNLITLDLNRLTSCEDVYFKKNELLQSINLCKLIFVERGFALLRNSTLNSICLENLKEIKKGQLQFLFNFSLKELNLNQLTTINGGLFIMNNDVLEKLDLNQLASVSHFGNITVSDNLKLTHLNLNNLKSEVYDVFIGRNQSLKNIDLCQLTSIKRYLYIEENTSLNSICFDDLSIIGIKLSIIGSKLENLDTFKNLKRVGFVPDDNDEFPGLTIVGNSTLTSCASLCNLLNSNGIKGYFQISNNPSACSSLDEIKSKCTTLSIDNELVDDFKTYPNPTQDILNLSTNLINPRYTITDVMGRILKNGIIKSSIIDISEFKSGVYYISLFKDNITFVKTIIKK